MNTGLTTTLSLLSGLLIALSIACDSTPAGPGQPSAYPTQVIPTPTTPAEPTVTPVSLIPTTPAGPTVTPVSPMPTKPAEPAVTPVIPTPTTPSEPAVTPASPTPTAPPEPLPTPADTPTPTPGPQDDSDGNMEALREVQAELDKHRALWTSGRADAYSFILEPMCFCPQDLLDPVTVLVVDGLVSSVTYVESGEAPDHDGYGRYVTIDDLFDTIQEAIDGNASEVIVTYDPEIGYPTDVRIDYDARMTDEEYIFTASTYTPGAHVPDGQTDALGKAQAELDKHRAVWMSNRANSYSYVLTPICFCPVDFVVPVTIRVKNEAVTSVTFVETGKAPEHDGFGRYVTIDELFDIIQEAIDGKASEINATYDPEVGYPTEAGIDYDARMADEEYMFIATDYTPED